MNVSEGDTLYIDDAVLKVNRVVDDFVIYSVKVKNDFYRDDGVLNMDEYINNNIAVR